MWCGVYVPPCVCRSMLESTLGGAHDTPQHFSYTAPHFRNYEVQQACPAVCLSTVTCFFVLPLFHESHDLAASVKIMGCKYY